MSNMILPPNMAGCSNCLETMRIPSAPIDNNYYGVPPFGYTSMLTLNAKIPQDTALNCATQAAMAIEPVALV